MTNVEDEVVNMTFNNSAFERNAQTTLGTLGKLKSSLSFSGASKGLDTLQQSSNRFSMNGMSGAVQGVSGKFLALSTIGVTALATLTSKAITTGAQMISALTLDPILGGYKEYETNLNSIQTILSNTKASGANLDDVNGALAKLNKYSDQTIYNFGEMAKNIGTFTAAGVDLDTSVNSIKGIANLAALSGSNSQQASTAMYQLSQAIASGKVGLQDWNSVVNAGMGGATFQRALAETAVAMGKVDDGALKLTGKMKTVTLNGQSFRDSIAAKPGEKSWLTSDVLTNTLQQFTGDLTDAQLKAQGFNKEQIKAIQSTAKTAQDAATKVKSITQLMDVAKETVGSGWAKTWQIVAGDFKEARSTFTEASNTVNGFLNTMSNARNKILGDWKKLGGRDVLILGIKNAFEALGKIVKPIKNAFQDIFPPATGASLFNLTRNFNHLMKALIPSGKTMENLRSIFRGVFGAISIGISVIKGIVGMFGQLFGAVGGGQGGFLDLAGSIGDLIYNFSLMLKKGNVIETFFDNLGGILAIPVQLFKLLARFIADVFGGFDTNAADKVAGSFDRIHDRLDPLQNLMNGFFDLMAKAGGFFAPFVKGFVGAFDGLGDALADVFDSSNFDSTLDAINTGLLGGITLLIAKWLKKGVSVDLGGGVFGSIKNTFGELTGTLKAMQTQIKAKALLMIAGAVALLTVSVVALSLIDSDALQKALFAMGVAFGQLLIAMKVMEGVAASKGFLKLPVVAGALILLGGAILVLSAAVKVLSTMSWEELAKGLIGVTVLLGAIAVAVKPLSANSAGMVTAGVGIIAIATAMKILASAVKDFGALSWEEIAKGMTSIAVALSVIAGALRLMPTKSVAAQGFALLLVAAALKVMASALKDFGSLSLEEIGKGMLGIAGALGIIALAMRLMPKDMLLQSVALIAVGVALKIIGQAIAKIGGLKSEVVGKGLLAIAAALGILAGALYLMNGSLAGSAALIVAAGALAILTPVLVTLGTLSWESIAKGLVAIAGAFTILGIAGLVLGPLAPAILGLAGALALVGSGLALAGAGALAFAGAFAIFAAAGTAGIAVIAGMLLLIPEFFKNFALGIVEFATTLAKNADAFAKAFVKLLSTLLDAIIKIAPKIGKTVLVLLHTMLDVLIKGIPAIADAGLKLLLGLLKAISSNIGKIVDVAVDIVVKFVNSIANNINKIIDAGFNLLIKFIQGITKAVNERGPELGAAGLDLAEALVRGMANGIVSLAGTVVDAAKDLAYKALDAFKDIFDVFSPSKQTHWIGEMVGTGLANGIKSQTGRVTGEAKDVGAETLKTLRASFSKVPGLMANDKSFSPVITPVLDLTKLQKDATKISGIVGWSGSNSPWGDWFKSEAAKRQLTAVHHGSWRSETHDADLMGMQAPSISIPVTITSPTPADPVVVYRATSNAVALAKEALKR